MNSEWRNFNRSIQHSALMTHRTVFAIIAMSLILIKETMKKIPLLLAACLIQAQAAYVEKPNDWSRIKTPSPDIPMAVGGYANGCQFGAQILPEQGIGYYDIRRFRNRFYSQPQTIALVQAVGQYVYQRTGEAMLIGDLSQPIGGLMSYGHASHQNGLDVDIYFASIKQGETPDKDHEAPSVVDKISGSMKFELWKPSYREALYAAANHPDTERIFVNSIIKHHLCQTESDRRWLNKIRPYGGHDGHFHVRLRCPLGNELCQSQKPIPAGDGCDEGLEKWISDQREAILNPKPQKPSAPKPRPEPPQSCLLLLEQMRGK